MPAAPFLRCGQGTDRFKEGGLAHAHAAMAARHDPAKMDRAARAIRSAVDAHIAILTKHKHASDVAEASTHTNISDSDIAQNPSAWTRPDGLLVPDDLMLVLLSHGQGTMNDAFLHSCACPTSDFRSVCILACISFGMRAQLRRVRPLVLVHSMSQAIEIEESAMWRVGSIRLSGPAASVREFPDLQLLQRTHLSCVHSLSLRFCNASSGIDLSTIVASCAGLKALSILSCMRLRNLRALDSLHKLCALQISGCSWLHSRLPSRSQTRVFLGATGPLEPTLASLVLPKLVALDLEDVPSLDAADLSFVAASPHLSQLRLAWLPNLESVTPLAACTSLQVLSICGCKSLNNIDALQSCTLLHEIQIDGSDGLIRNLTPLTKCTGLKTLRIAHCLRLQGLSSLATSPTLQTLHIKVMGGRQRLREARNATWRLRAASKRVLICC
eukprot:CAMPEP_0119319074 /NCGR_PEP_ID=MMETSP1333-20130426/48405_1 /TAXON_ID=418940 /ORGANISM="Scyphosphaera apsteinii, Strain RCC1455" /LENGTH=441 /DNA_ID=CAMNT_0007325407 /DNA_START=31 /DNA_END=1356 /DNA_ORIENTATION=+